jgi:hypothetical protein
MPGNSALAGLLVLAAAAPAAAYLAPLTPLTTGRPAPAAGALRPQLGALPGALRRAPSGAGALRCQSVQALVEKASKAAPNTKAPTSMFKALKKKTGVKSISYEFKRRTDIEANSQFEMEEMSFNLRVDCKPGLLMYDSMDENGVSDADAQEDIKMIVKEQSTAKGKFPGPVPIVWRKKFETIEQIAEAKALGCYSVTLLAEPLGGDKLQELVNVCHALGMEPLVEVNDKDQISAAVAAGAKCINVRFSSDAVASFLVYATKSLAGDLLATKGDFAAIATVQARQGGPEIEQAQAVLALEGFNGVLFSQAILDARDRENRGYTGYLAQVLNSKKSTKIVINEKKANTGIGGYGAAQGWGNEGTHV